MIVMFNRSSVGWSFQSACLFVDPVPAEEHRGRLIASAVTEVVVLDASAFRSVVKKAGCIFRVCHAWVGGIAQSENSWSK